MNKIMNNVYCTILKDDEKYYFCYRDKDGEDSVELIPIQIKSLQSDIAWAENQGYVYNAEYEEMMKTFYIKCGFIKK